MGEVEFEEGLHIVEIVGENFIVHPAFAHGAARHQEAVLDRVLHRAGQGLRKGRAANIIEAVAAAGVCKDRDRRLRAQKARREEHRVRAAGDVQGAVGVLGDNAAKEREHGFGLVHSRTRKDQLGCQSAMIEVCLQLRADTFLIIKIIRAYIDHPLWAEHLHPEHVFQRSFVVQFDERLHGAPPLRLLLT